MVKTSTRQLIGSVKEFLKHCSSDDVTVEEDGLSSGERMDAVMGMTRSVANVWTLISVKRNFISVEEGWFWTYVTEAFGSVNDR